MKTAKHVDPGHFSLRAVRPGDRYSKAVDGGVRTHDVPGLGLVVGFADRDVFLPAGQVAAELARLAVPVVVPKRPRGRR